MKILFIGDIVGKSAREIIKERIPTIKDKYNQMLLLLMLKMQLLDMVYPKMMLKIYLIQD